MTHCQCCIEGLHAPLKGSENQAYWQCEKVEHHHMKRFYLGNVGKAARYQLFCDGAEGHSISGIKYRQDPRQATETA